jgi:hypothetical protein
LIHRQVKINERKTGQKIEILYNKKEENALRTTSRIKYWGISRLVK